MQNAQLANLNLGLWGETSSISEKGGAFHHQEREAEPTVYKPLAEQVLAAMSHQSSLQPSKQGAWCNQAGGQGVAGCEVGFVASSLPRPGIPKSSVSSCLQFHRKDHLCLGSFLCGSACPSYRM